MIYIHSIYQICALQGKDGSPRFDGFCAPLPSAYAKPAALVQGAALVRKRHA